VRAFGTSGTRWHRKQEPGLRVNVNISVINNNRTTGYITFDKLLCCYETVLVTGYPGVRAVAVMIHNLKIVVQE